MHAVARFGFGVVSNFALGKIWFRKVRSILSHFVRKDSSHLTKTITGLFGRYDYSKLGDKTKIFFAVFFTY